MAPTTKESQRVQKWRDEHKDEYNAYMREYRRKPLITDPDESKRKNPHDKRHPSPHGTAQRYRRHGCKCPLCEQARRDDDALQYARRKAKKSGETLDEAAWWEKRLS